MTSDERFEFLNKHKVVQLKKAYSCFISSRGVSKLRKRALVEQLGSWVAFPGIYKLLMSGDTDNYVPVWREMEASVKKPTHSLKPPWPSFYERTDFEPSTYKDGKEFLLNWGISVTEPRSRVDFSNAVVPSNFTQLWEDDIEPLLHKESKPNDIYQELSIFYDKLDYEVQALLPNNFSKRAAMVYDRLKLHQSIKDGWSELDFEVKVYCIWHDFFGEFDQRADKNMLCLPKGAQYEGVNLFPDMLMTNGSGVPCIIIENGAELATCPLHKDAVKVLAEGRLASTFTLGHFVTDVANCFLVLNGGKNMSLIDMKAKFNTNANGEIERIYEAQFILEVEKQDNGLLTKSKTGITLQYNLESYSQIIELFVAIYIYSMRFKFDHREESLTFTNSMVLVHQGGSQQLKPNPHTPSKGFLNVGKKLPQPKSLGKKDNEPVDALFPTSHQVLLPSLGLTVTINQVKRSIRELVSTSWPRYCGKVLELEQGNVPFEVELMLKLNHSNILKVQEIVFNESKTHCMVVTEWIRDALNARLCGLEKTAVAKDVLLALEYLHDNNVVHADVKLANVVALAGERDPQTRLDPMHGYLIDFGVSFYADSPPIGVIGTVPYIAPEVVQQHWCSQAMDMWGFGLLLFELYCGCLRTQDKDFNAKQATIDWYNNQKYKFVLVESLFNLIWRCLEDDPAKRLTAKQALQHPFWKLMARTKPNSPVESFILGNVMNFDGPVDWEVVAKEDELARGRNLARKTIKGQHSSPQRKVLGDVTNIL